MDYWCLIVAAARVGVVVTQRVAQRHRWRAHLGYASRSGGSARTVLRMFIRDELTWLGWQTFNADAQYVDSTSSMYPPVKIVPCAGRPTSVLRHPAHSEMRAPWVDQGVVAVRLCA